MSRDRVVQLQERAEELGFSTITEAIDAGYHEVQDLDDNTFTLEKIDVAGYEQQKAHEAWLEEKHQVLHTLESIKEDIIDLNNGDNNHVAIDELNYVIDFIEKGEC